MAFALSDVARAEGYRLEAHETVASTNAIALERARAGDAGKLWIVSDHQTSGRGRRGRAWQTPRGNLAATLLLIVDAERLGQAATLGFVAGLSLGDALEAVAPGVAVKVAPDGADGVVDRSRRSRFELKWPNDVLAGGAKLAGILLESAILPHGGAAIAIGIGVNVVAFPDDLSYPATSLTKLGSGVGAVTLFTALSQAWTDNVLAWNEGDGLGEIRGRWLARAAGLGGEVAVKLDGRVVRGTFETIDEDCRFVMRSADGAAIRITAGDVHFGAVASASAA